MPELPAGTVTLLFTDIEGSTQLLRKLGDGYAAVLADHHRLLRDAFAAHQGYEVDTQGDAFFAAFARATEAVTAAVEAQWALAQHPWPEEATVRVRMGLHTGEPLRTAEGYTGLDVVRAARLAASGHGGQVLLSQPTADLVQSELPVEMSLRPLGEHRFKGLAHPEQVFQLSIPGLPAEFPPLQAAGAAPTNLPVQRTALIGRERELAELCALMRRDDVGLVTVTGSGGTGKTRLSLAVVTKLLPDFPDGVFFVALAPITDPSLIPSAIAQALGVREVGGMSLLQTLKDFLLDKQLLLLLDNFEQVVEAASAVLELLESCLRLKVLVSSRMALHLVAEQLYPLPPLQLPNVAPLPPIEELAQIEALRLFTERARLVQPDFTLTEANAATVVAICQRLDGLPLALELAAARIRLLPPQALLARLGNRLQLLTGGARNLSHRQQSLRGTIEWSYELLDRLEKVLFWRLAVFSGGCTPEAVEAICNADADLGVGVLDIIGSLVDKSLLQQVERDSGEPRFVMLETIRELAGERLEGSSEAERVRNRHLAFFLWLAEQAELHRDGPNQRVWLDRLDAELDNIRAAFAWSQRDERLAIEGLRLAATLHLGFWNALGHFSEGQTWLEQALRATPDAPPVLRAKALYTLGDILRVMESPGPALPLLEESAALYRQEGDEEALAPVLALLSVVSAFLGDHPTARSFSDESLSLFQARGTRSGLALSQYYAGQVAVAAGDDARARSYFEQCAALWRAENNHWRLARVLGRLGDLAYRRGEYAAARDCYEECLRLNEETRDRRTVVDFLGSLALTLLALGNWEQAWMRTRECLLMAQALGIRGVVAKCLGGFARISAGQGQGERTVRLFAAAAVYAATTGGVILPASRAEYDGDVAAVRASLGEAAFAAAWADGQAMALDQAITYALEELPST